MNLTPTILLAEDDENDFMLMKMAFGRCGSEIALRRVSNGEEVIRYLQREGRYRDREQYPFPRLLLLDLKMPGRSGFEVLSWIRSHPASKPLIVAILTGSANEEDIVRAYKNGANSYLVKPDTIGELVRMAGKIKGYWLELNTNPDCSGEENRLL